MAVLVQGKYLEMQDLQLVQKAVFPYSFSGTPWFSYSNCKTATWVDARNEAQN